MTEHDGSMTDRWMGVFRSVEHVPMGDARFAGVQAQRRRSITLALTGLAVLVAPAVLTAMALELLIGLVYVALSAWIFCPIVGAGFAYTGIKRYVDMRAIRTGSEVEVFEGTTPMKRVPGMYSTALDGATIRLINEGVILTGRTHRLVVHPETGLVIEVDGVLVDTFVRCDVSITARIAPDDPNALARPLGVLDNHELRLVTRRLTRGTWGPLLGVASAATALVSCLWASTSDGDPEPHVMIAVVTVCALLLIAAAVDGWYRRLLRATLQRDGEAGLHRTDHGWQLPESGICWEENGRPGPLRLAGGGLGSEADGRTRPVMF